VQHAEHLDDAVGRHDGFLVEQRQVTDRAERITRINSLCDPITRPNRRLAVAQLVAVFDVVVHERVVMEDLDRDGRVERAFKPAALGEGGSQEQLWTQALPRLHRSRCVVAEVVADHLIDRRRPAVTFERSCQVRLDDAN